MVTPNSNWRIGGEPGETGTAASGWQIGAEPPAPEPAGVFDPRVWKGVGAAATRLPQLTGAGLFGIAQSGPSDLEVLERMELRDEDREVLAQRWFNKPYQQMLVERQTGQEPRQVLREMTRGLRKEVQDSFPEQMTGTAEVVAGAAQSITQNLPGLALSVLTRSPVPAATVAGASAGGQTIAEGIAEDKDPGALARAGAVSAAAETGFETLSLGLSGLLTKGAKNRILRFILAEEATELPTTLVQESIEKIEYRPEETWGEFAPKLRDALIQTALQTPLAAGAQGALVRGIQKLEQLRDPNYKLEDALSEGEQKFLDVMREVRAGEELQRIGQQVDFSPALERMQKLLGEKVGEGLIGASNATLPEQEIAPDAPPLPAPEQVDALLAELRATLPATVTPEALAEEEAKVAALEAQAAVEAQAAATKAQEPPATPTSAAVDDVGQSAKATANALNYSNPNDGKLPSELPITVGPEELIGKTLKSFTAPGTIVIGEESQDRPKIYLAGVQATVEKWRAKYLPNARVVISNQSLPILSANGAHQVAADGTHVILPPPVRRFAELGPGQFQPKTQWSAFYSLAHEFGHAIIQDRLFGVLAPELANGIRKTSLQGPIPEDLIAQTPSGQQALLREYNAARTAATDGTWTAQDLVNNWLGIQKTVRTTFLADLNIAPSAPAIDVFKKIAGRAGMQMAAREVKRARSQVDKNFTQFIAREQENSLAALLSLDEYLAEQMTRYAYVKNWDANTQLKTKKLFRSALEGLRKFFVEEVKNEQIVSPGAKFVEWMDGLTKTQKLRNAPQKDVGKNKEPKAEPAAPKARGKKTPEATLPAPAPEPVIVDPAPVTEQKINYRALLEGTVKSGLLQRSDPEYKRLATALKTGAIDDFLEDIQPYLEKNVRFSLGDLPEVENVRVVDATDSVESIQLQPIADDGLDRRTDTVQPPTTTAGLVRTQGFTERPTWSKPARVLFARTRVGIDKTGNPVGVALDPAWLGEGELTPEIMAQAAGEWKRNTIRSRFFKAWFGDWEDATSLSGVLRADGLPWVGFHASDGRISDAKGNLYPFLAFDRGDIGFHIGTARAANLRGMKMESKDLASASTPSVKKLIEQQAAMYAELLRTDEPRGLFQAGGTYIMPLFVAVKNPVHIGREQGDEWSGPWQMLDKLQAERILTFREADAVRAELRVPPGEPSALRQFAYFAPVRRALQAKGYDGLTYDNLWEGDVTVVAFEPNQIKSAYSNIGTFSQSGQMHFDLDFDDKTEEGMAAGNMLRTLKKINPGYEHGPLRRALRWMKYRSLELQQIAHLHPEVGAVRGLDGRMGPGLPTQMVQMNDRYTRDKASMQAEADRITEEAEQLPSDRQQQLFKAFTAEVKEDALWPELAQNATGTWEFQSSARLRDKLREHGIDDTTEVGRLQAEMYLKVKRSLLHSLNQVELQLQQALVFRYAQNPALLAAKVRTLAMKTHLIRTKPFFPRGDFGKYVLVLEEDKPDGKGKTVVWREAYEKEADYQERREYIMRAKKPNQHLRAEPIKDRQYVFMGLPHDFIELAASELGLSQDEIATLTVLMQPVKTEKGLKPFQLPTFGLAGSNQDWPRTYANFMWHTSNLIAKLKYRPRFREILREMDKLVRETEKTGDTRALRDLTDMRNFMNQTFDYIMAPPNELHQLRALVSLSYLGFNLKTALLNLYGLATTWSDLAAKEGTAQGTAHMLSSLVKTWNATQLTDLNAPAKEPVMAPDTQRAYDRAIEEGVLAQSYAYHLAGVANSPSLSRLRQQRYGGRALKNAMDAGMWLFRLTELGTRRATFIAQFEVARKRGLSENDAYQEAVTVTSALQNDYSYGNRVPFMRGIKTQTGNPLFEGAVPMATIFMSFAQHMAFHTFGGYEMGLKRQALLNGTKHRKGYTFRIWLLTLLMAGYEGLPGMENLMDLIDALFKKLYGGSARQELREVINEVGGDPVFWSRGLAHNVGGFDLSRSAGFGRIVPGTDVLSRSTQGDVNQLFGAAALDLLGPFGGWLRTLLNVGFGKDSTLEALSKGPGAVGALVSAYRWSQDGVRTPGGAKLTYDLQTGEVRDLTAVEIMGKALSFNPTVVSQNREIRYAQLDAKMFWQEKRTRLLEDYWEAIRRADGEAVKEMKEAVARYNALAESRGHKELKLTQKQIADSIRLRRQRMAQEERTGAAPERRYRIITQEIRDSFSDN